MRADAREAGRVDIHFHLLPGIDDGPRTLDESAALAAAAAAAGTETVVATPHVRPDYVTDVADLRDLVRAVEERLARDGTSLRIRQGAELGHMMVGRMQQAELEAIALGPPGGRWLLVESPFAGLREDFSAATDELRDRGFGVVVAHPERAEGALEEGAAVLRHEIERGSMLQLNAWSLAGRHGGESRAVAQRLLALGHPTVVASDAHGGWRMPALDLGLDAAVAAGLSSSDAQRLVSANPRQLLERGLPVPLYAG